MVLLSQLREDQTHKGRVPSVHEVNKARITAQYNRRHSSLFHIARREISQLVGKSVVPVEGSGQDVLNYHEKIDSGQDVLNYREKIDSGQDMLNYREKIDSGQDVLNYREKIDSLPLPAHVKDSLRMEDIADIIRKTVTPAPREDSDDIDSADGDYQLAKCKHVRMR